MEELPVQAEVRERETVVQQIIMNNELHEVKDKVQALCCSSCGKAFFKFALGTSYEDAYKQVLASKENLQSKLNVCPGCGKKLRYDFDIIDGEIIDEQVSL